MTLFAEGRIIDVDSKVRMPQWNLLLLLLLLLMMMTTMIVSVELEGVTHRQTDRQKVQVIAFWKKSSPAAAAAAAVYLVYFFGCYRY